MRRGSFEVLWSEMAIRDLEQIVDFIAEEAPLAAERVFEQIADRARTLASLPWRGRVVPELARFETTTIRELVVPPYRLVYQIRGKSVLVSGVFDGRRSLEEVLLARLHRS
jgi:addiction module RelE/StbE family toxin